MKTLLSTFAVAMMLTSVSFAADSKYKEGSCCDKAQKASKKCEHPCCVDAEKAGKVCEKCNKK